MVATKPIDFRKGHDSLAAMVKNELRKDPFIRPIALNRKNALFAGHDAGAENWAVIALLVETCKMNGIDPQAWPAATLTAIVQGHKQSQIDDLLPWSYAAKV
ncbi:transposase domain-containing protein [Paracoccus sp. (in: a-proteobacteria)]|uniref:transposase domain-containing protein n=1 Tax=Paracoccus sp. TaxID=267 RepID=UPI003A521708